MLLTSDERERRRAARELSARPEDLAAIELKEAANLQKEIKNGDIKRVFFNPDYVLVKKYKNYLMAKNLNPSLKILARANHAGSVERLYRAGASFVALQPMIGGQVIAGTVLADQVQVQP